MKEALKLLPEQSHYHAVIKDVIDYHDSNPSKTYEDCWRFTSDKYLTMNNRGDCNIEHPGNIMASFNGAFIAIGILYGEGDIVKTVEYSLRCGQDSDCNPSNAACVVGTMLGYDNLPQQWRTAIEDLMDGTFSGSTYTYAKLLSTSITRAKRAILDMGGDTANGRITINAETPRAPAMFEQWGHDPVQIGTTSARPAVAGYVRPAGKGQAMRLVGPTAGGKPDNITRLYTIHGKLTKGRRTPCRGILIEERR